MSARLISCDAWQSERLLKPTPTMVAMYFCRPASSGSARRLSTTWSTMCSTSLIGRVRRGTANSRSRRWPTRCSPGIHARSTRPRSCCSCRSAGTLGSVRPCVLLKSSMTRAVGCLRRALARERPTSAMTAARAGRFVSGSNVGPERSKPFDSLRTESKKSATWALMFRRSSNGHPSSALGGSPCSDVRPHRPEVDTQRRPSGLLRLTSAVLRWVVGRNRRPALPVGDVDGAAGEGGDDLGVAARDIARPDDVAVEGDGVLEKDGAVAGEALEEAARPHEDESVLEI